MLKPGRLISPSAICHLFRVKSVGLILQAKENVFLLFNIYNEMEIQCSSETDHLYSSDYDFDELYKLLQQVQQKLMNNNIQFVNYNIQSFVN